MSGVYDAMTMTELFICYSQNMKVLATAIREILGDEPMPDPRELADMMANIPQEAWERTFQDPEGRKLLAKNLDLTKVVAEIQTENAAIIDAALKK